MSLSLIGDALFTKTQQRVLALLYGRPDQRFHTNEIIRQAGMGRGTVRRELTSMIEASLLTVGKEGNQHYYQANAANPVYVELLGLVRKTLRLADVIRAALQPLDEKITTAFVYGSIAKSEDHKRSDIDLMLIGEDLNSIEVMEQLHPVEIALGRPIHPVIYTPRMLQARLAEGISFTVRVMEQPKIMIKGTCHDIGKSDGNTVAASGIARAKRANGVGKSSK